MVWCSAAARQESVSRYQAAMMRKDAPPADRAEYRKALELYPDLSKDHGEMPKIYNMFALEVFQGQLILEESVKHRLKVMRAELAGSNPGQTRRARTAYAARMCAQKPAQRVEESW